MFSVKKNEKLPAGTALELEIPEVHETPIAAQDIPLEVCYEDAVWYAITA